MDSYKIFETDVFLEDVESLSNALKGKLTSYIYPQLRKEPHFGNNIKKLKNWESEMWRYRVSDLRFFYEINEQEKIVYMVAISHRKDAYR